MFNSLFKQLTSSIGIVFRTFRSFFSRMIVAAWSRVRRVTSFTRQAAKLAPKMLKTATLAGKKPVKRGDYVETKRLFIAKSFFVILGVVLVALAMLIYFLVWPWLVSQFFTARMWYQDKNVEGYKGKVILYYNEQKTDIMYEGRLLEGLYEGDGLFYDEDGFLLYSGAFAAGQYEGAGTLYEKGEAVYEGEFSAGLFEGNGVMYSGGEMIYAGEFSAGAYEGSGIAYENEEMVYKGSFSNGLYNGDGVEYYPGSKVKFKGVFLDGLYSGDGTLYNEDGSTKYTGGFAEGLYSGTGSLYLEDNQRIDAEFEGGKTAGSIQWYKGGELYYSGAADDITPNGFGTIYSASEKELYAGSMKMGAIDTAGLLGLAVGDVREMLAGSTLREIIGGDSGFTITAEELGLSMFCSFKSESEESQVYYAYLYDSRNSNSLSSSQIWESPAQFELWLEKAGVTGYIRTSGWAETSFQSGLPFVNGMWYCTAYVLDDCSVCLWSSSRSSEVRVAEWRRGSNVPEATELEGGEGASDSAKRMEALLTKLENDGVGGSTSGSTKNEYYGSSGVSGAFSQTDDVTKKYEAYANMLDFFESAERRKAAEEKAELLQELLDEENQLIKTGSGSSERADSLQKDISNLKLEIAKYETQMQKNQMLVINSLGVRPSSYDLQQLLVLFDPAKVDKDAANAAAIAYAQALLDAAQPPEEEPSPEPTPSEEPSELPSEEPSELPSESPEASPEVQTEAEYQTVVGVSVMVGAIQGDAIVPLKVELSETEKSNIKMDVNLCLIELQLAYAQIDKAKSDYESAVKSLDEAEKAYQTASVEKSVVYDAICYQNDCRAALYSALADFSAQAAKLNELTGGWVSRQYKWLSGAF